MRYHIIILCSVFFLYISVCASDLTQAMHLGGRKNIVSFKPANPKLFEENANRLLNLFDAYEAAVQSRKEDDIEKSVTSINSTLDAIDDLLPRISRTRLDILDLLKSVSRPSIYKIVRKDPSNLKILKENVIKEIKNFAEPDEENEFVIIPSKTSKGKQQQADLEASQKLFGGSLNTLKEIVKIAEDDFQKNHNMFGAQYLDRRLGAIRSWSNKDAQIAALQMLAAYYHANFKGDNVKAERFYSKVNNELRSIAKQFSQPIQPLIVHEKERKKPKIRFVEGEGEETLFFKAKERLGKLPGPSLVMEERVQKKAQGQISEPYYKIHKIGKFSQKQILDLGKNGDILTEFCDQSAVPSIAQLKNETSVIRLKRYYQTVNMCACVQKRSEEENTKQFLAELDKHITQVHKQKRLLKNDKQFQTSEISIDTPKRQEIAKRQAEETLKKLGLEKKLGSGEAKPAPLPSTAVSSTSAQPSSLIRLQPAPSPFPAPTSSAPTAEVKTEEQQKLSKEDAAFIQYVLKNGLDVRSDGDRVRDILLYQYWLLSDDQDKGLQKIYKQTIATPEDLEKLLKQRSEITQPSQPSKPTVSPLVSITPTSTSAPSSTATPLSLVAAPTPTSSVSMVEKEFHEDVADLIKRYSEGKPKQRDFNRLTGFLINDYEKLTSDEDKALQAIFKKQVDKPEERLQQLLGQRSGTKGIHQPSTPNVSSEIAAIIERNAKNNFTTDDDVERAMNILLQEQLTVDEIKKLEDLYKGVRYLYVEKITPGALGDEKLKKTFEIRRLMQEYERKQSEINQNKFTTPPPPSSSTTAASSKMPTIDISSTPPSSLAPSPTTVSSTPAPAPTPTPAPTPSTPTPPLTSGPSATATAPSPVTPPVPTPTPTPQPQPQPQQPTGLFGWFNRGVSWFNTSFIAPVGNLLSGLWNRFTSWLF